MGGGIDTATEVANPFWVKVTSSFFPVKILFCWLVFAMDKVLWLLLSLMTAREAMGKFQTLGV